MIDVLQISNEELKRQEANSDVVGFIVVKKNGGSSVLVRDPGKVIRDPYKPDIQQVRDVEILKEAVDKNGGGWCNWDGIWWPC